MSSGGVSMNTGATAMTDRPERCDRCRWWHSLKTENAYGEPIGQCRAATGVAAQELPHVGVWPRTSAPDWCGQFRPKEAESPESLAERVEMLEGDSLTSFWRAVRSRENGPESA